jgi:hypothetical protein
MKKEASFDINLKTNGKTKKFMNIVTFYIWKKLLQVCVLCFV